MINLDLSESIARCEENAGKQKAILETEMIKSTQLVADAYDRFLKIFHLQNNLMYYHAYEVMNFNLYRYLS